LDRTRLVARQLLGLGLLLGGVTCAPRSAPTPSAACASLWDEPEASDFVETLTAATSTALPVWPGYQLGDGFYVLYAGDTPSGEACVGLWHAGRTVDFAQLPDSPRFSTPLYGYFLPDAPRREAVDGFPSGRQPDELASWLESNGVERATIMPVRVEDFPIELPPLVKTQVGLHEAFHVEVQSAHWVGAEADWPSWDRQPDREDLQSCYAATPRVEETLSEERESLVRMIEALLDGRRADACRAGRNFLERRSARHRLLDTLEVEVSDGDPTSCAMAEAIMELEEGTADYASWTKLFELELASRDQLLRRYRAVQDDVYYLTGVMQLHAIAAMRPEGMETVTARIAASETVRSGAIPTVFEETMADACP
jgi:hypothetical protein